MKLDDFTNAYVVCALWSTNDESDETGRQPLDLNYDIEDINNETLQGMINDCKLFQQKIGAVSQDSYIGSNPDNYNVDTMIGHDFWLTRNGHGAGFWDGDWEKSTGERLDSIAKCFGETYIYIGDDNKIYS